MKEKISLLIVCAGFTIMGIGIGGCVSENISNTANAQAYNDWKIKRMNYDLTEIVDPETGVHYLLYDTGYEDGGAAITVMCDNDGQIKHDK